MSRSTRFNARRGDVAPRSSSRAARRAAYLAADRKGATRQDLRRLRSDVLADEDVTR